MLLYPTYRWEEVAASSVTRTFCGSLNWLSPVSPTPFAASSVQSCGSQARSSPGAHAQSCGPEVVLRAVYSLPPKAAICGNALSAGSRSSVLRVVMEVFAPYGELLGVEVVQGGRRPSKGGSGSLVFEWTIPPLFAR